MSSTQDHSKACPYHPKRRCIRQSLEPEAEWYQSPISDALFGL
ncbi:hypothetical protein AcetOrient_orf01267 [Acetobacter orientalis]|uniref:Uncharacterized protein n=1 Tax=Acetobacter orientalis TaxID=146474 RepID=A0A2Z5ZEU5_9PROT|nr:hypothetical protein AcetOrient_orf01267 [Acetobacter orientalis]